MTTSVRAAARLEKEKAAEEAGKQAALAGQDFDSCPYAASMYNSGNRFRAPLRRAWEKGYGEGLVEAATKRSGLALALQPMKKAGLL